MVEQYPANTVQIWRFPSQDSSGTIEAKKWEVAPGDEEILAVKKVVAVEGYPLIYNQSQLQFKLTEVEPVSNYNEEDLILDAPVDRKLLEEKFLGYIDAIEDVDITEEIDVDMLVFYLQIMQTDRLRSHMGSYWMGDVTYEIHGTWNGKPLHINIGTQEESQVYESGNKGGYRIKNPEVWVQLIELLRQ